VGPPLDEPLLLPEELVPPKLLPLEDDVASELPLDDELEPPLDEPVAPIELEPALLPRVADQAQ